MYKITPYSYERARELGVKIKPSTRKYKKIDVFDKDDNYITSIGDNRYMDYPSYIRDKGKDYALERRRLYRIRHDGEQNNKGSAGYYSWWLLW